MHFPKWLTMETRARMLSSPSLPTPTISQSIATARVNLKSAVRLHPFPLNPTTTQRAAGVSPLKRVLFHQHFLRGFCAGLQHSATLAYDVCSLGPQSRLDVIRVHVIKPDISPTRKRCLKRTVRKLESTLKLKKTYLQTFYLTTYFLL